MDFAGSVRAAEERKDYVERGHCKVICGAATTFKDYGIDKKMEICKLSSYILSFVIKKTNYVNTVELQWLEHLWDHEN